MEGARRWPVSAIVVADDQDDSRDLIEFLLTQQGAVVTGAASAAEAFAAIKEHPPDVLLSDIEMPDENGYALIGRVRALTAAEGGTVPAAAMTAHGSREDRDRALAAGFQRHLPKPFQPARPVCAGRRPGGARGASNPLSRRRSHEHD